MRVTESSIATNFLFNVNKSRERITQLQTQLASGKRVLKASDDPQAADSILRLKSFIERIDQFQKNNADSQSMMEMTGAMLDSFANVLFELKELVTRVSNGTQTEVLGTYADRVDALLSEAVNIANTKFNGKYLFGGTRTLEPPFAIAPNRSAVTANPNGITGAIEYPLGEGLMQTVNIDGQEAFMGTYIFDLMIQLRDDLRSGQFPTTAQIDSISTALDYILGKAAKAGSILQSLGAIEVQLEEQRAQLMGLLSIQQDTDIAESITKLKHEEIMLEAALNTGARIIPKSLLDFLR